MNDDQTPPAKIVPGIYRHYKGNLYEVIDSARHTETRESLTLYLALYGERGLWVRPTTMFSDEMIVDGTSQRRFVLVEDRS